MEFTFSPWELEVNSQLLAVASLFPREKLLVRNEQEGVWTTDPVWTLWRVGNILPV
jgi:hypothetical protein